VVCSDKTQFPDLPSARRRFRRDDGSPRYQLSQLPAKLSHLLGPFALRVERWHSNRIGGRHGEGGL